jgi:hypothetical protein
MPATRRAVRAAAFAVLALAPGSALACACGCGVFDLGEVSLPMTSDTGFSTWFRYSFMDQTQNWEGAHRASGADNGDKEIRTSFFTLGGEYMINRQWTVMAEAPIFDRAFTSTDDGTIAGPAGSIYHAHDNALGDLQLMAVWTGLSPDMSTGLTFGLKLPTGDWHGPNGPLGGAAFDRDSLPGTGDLTRGGKLSWFVQARYQVAVAEQEGYRPGNELDGAIGVVWQAASFGREGKVTPVLQVLDSWRLHDTGSAADPLNSGYERVLISPGVNVRFNRHLALYADVEVPVRQHFNAAPNLDIEGTSGQLAAPLLIKTQISYNF